MTISKHQRQNGFTLVELLIGVSLALMLMTAVLSTYVSLGRNFTRTLGLSSANQPSLESQARRTIATFAQDVRMASAVSSPSVNSVTLVIATGTGTTNITYSYNSTAGTLTRTPTTGATLVLQSSLLSFYFRYYDISGSPYDNGSSPYTTVLTYSISGIKQVSFNFTSQAGSATNGTLTQIFQTASPRLFIRNNSLLR